MFQLSFRPLFGVGHRRRCRHFHPIRCAEGTYITLPPESLEKNSIKFCVPSAGPARCILRLESVVTTDKIYSVYIARDQKLIREHAHRSGIPADSICEVKAVIDPSTATLSTDGVCNWSGG